MHTSNTIILTYSRLYHSLSSSINMLMHTFIHSLHVQHYTHSCISIFLAYSHANRVQILNQPCSYIRHMHVWICTHSYTYFHAIIIHFHHVMFTRTSYGWRKKTNQRSGKMHCSGRRFGRFRVCLSLQNWTNVEGIGQRSLFDICSPMS